MAIRSLLTAGAAFAAAGAITVTTVIAPPLAPRDIEVVQKTEAQVRLAAQLELADLINVFFGVTPQGAYPTEPPTEGDILLPGVTDAAGTAGAFGVLYQLLMQQQGAYQPGRDGLETYWNGGLTAYIQKLLVDNNADPNAVAGINGFFEGGLAQLAYQYLASGTTNPEVLTYLASYFGQGDFGGSPATSGLTGVIYLRLLAGFQDPQQQAFLNNFFQGGASQVVYNQLGGDLGGEEPGTTTPYLSAFFGINNAYADPDGTGSPALSGASGVVYTRLKQAGDAGDLTPEQMSVIDPFFNGGTTEVVRTQLLARTTDPHQINLINEFFDNGVSGVVRYLLVGPEPVAPPEEEEEETTLFAARSAGPAVDDEKVEDETPEPTVATVAAATTEAEKKEPAVEAKPVAAAAPSAPATESAPAAEPESTKPTFTAKIREQSVKEEKEAEATTTGNKAEPEILVGTGGPKPGSGSWGILGDIAKGVHDAIANAGKPAAPSAPAAGGAESGAGDSAGGGDSGGGEG